MPGQRGEYRASRQIIWQSLSVILTEFRQTTYNSSNGKGTETEPMARAAYEAITGSMVQQVGFVDHEQIADAGYSH
jgi:hypothetical protein